jgi:hypothetical protein
MQGSLLLTPSPLMRYGVALAECVQPDHDTLMAALDAFASRSRMPDLVPVWVRRWQLDRRILRGIRERGAEPTLYVESTGFLYHEILAGKHDAALRLLACKADGLVVRWDQEPMSEGLKPPWFRHPLYLPTFGYVSELMRGEADVRLAYCATNDVDAMAEFYPGDACQIVGFDAFSRAEFGRFPPEQWRLPTDVLSRLAPGKPVWVFEAGRLVGLPRRAAWLKSIAQVEGIEVAVPWDMDVPDHEDDFTWTPAMDRVFAGMTE